MDIPHTYFLPEDDKVSINLTLGEIGTISPALSCEPDKDYVPYTVPCEYYTKYTSHRHRLRDQLDNFYNTVYPHLEKYKLLKTDEEPNQVFPDQFKMSFWFYFTRAEIACIKYMLDKYNKEAYITFDYNIKNGFWEHDSYISFFNEDMLPIYKKLYEAIGYDGYKDLR